MYIFALGVFLPFAVYAEGTIQLPQTGQTKCYDSAGAEQICSASGQDGELRKGVEWPSPRFKPEADCLIDQLTGLMWPKDGNVANGTRNWDEAVDYPKTADLCGHADWRLPHINELESLVNASQSNTASWLNTQGFTNVQPGFYWSSTTKVSGSDTFSALGIAMDFGAVAGQHKSSFNHIWPVRAGQPGALDNAFIWRTGQTASYRAGDDGDLKQGASWPSPRFTDEGNGEVTDSLTGLVWTKDTHPSGPTGCSDAQFKTWQEALDHVNCLNIQNYLGHNDWRLPNRKELRSLFDCSQTNPALPPDHPFIHVEAGFYWSSTTVAGNAGHAWYTYMPDGLLYGNWSKSDSNYVWPVRAGQVWPIRMLKITKTGSGNGSVTTDAGAIMWNGSVGTVAYHGGTSIHLSAAPDSGSVFAGWSGACSGRGACNIVMNVNTEVAAAFSLQGDVNADGAVDLADAVAGLQIASSQSPQPIAVAADVNSDSRIGLEEVFYVLQKLGGQRLSETVGRVGLSGGTVEVTDAASPIRGAKVIVPEGATAPGEEVAIRISYQDAPPAPVNKKAAEAELAGKILLLAKSGSEEFLKPVEVVFPYDETRLDTGDIPSVLYWDEAEQQYFAAEITAVDRAAKTVTFTTTHFSTFVFAVIKGLYMKLEGMSYPSLPTGLKPDADGFFHANDTYVYNVGLGACVGMSSYAIWYYLSKKAVDGNGLYAKYRKGALDDWSDDNVALELLIRTAMATRQGGVMWQTTKSIMTMSSTGLALIQNMEITGQPQVLGFNYQLNARHAVVVHGYDSAGKFLIYDPNHPGKEVTVNWSPFTGFTGYSDPPPGTAVVGPFNYTFHASHKLYQGNDFENLYQGGENPWTEPLFNAITIKSPALNADGSVTVRGRSGSTVYIEGTVTGGIRPAKYLAFRVLRLDPLPKLLSDVVVLDLSANGGFKLPLSFGAGTFQISFLATDVRSEAAMMRPHTYAGMTRLLAKVEDFNGPLLLGSLELPGEAYDVQAAGSHAFVVDKSYGLRVVDVANPDAPSLKASLYLDPYQYGRSIFISGSYAHIGVGYLAIVDIKDPANPVFKTGEPAGDASDVVVVAGTTYIASGGSAAPLTGRFSSMKLDVSDPANVKLTPQSYILFTDSDIRGVAASGDYAYVFDPIGGWLYVVSIPIMHRVKEIRLGGSDSIFCGVFKAGDTVYAISKNKFSIVDVSHPLAPALVKEMASGYGRDVSVSGTRAYVLGAKYLATWDVTDPANPVFIGSAELAGNGMKLFVSGGTAYVAEALANSKGSLSIYKVD
jgi:hypothetical protein